MRLIAVPLARIRPGAQPVTTFLAQSTKATIKAQPQSQTQSQQDASTSSSNSTSNNSNTPKKIEEKPPLTKRIMNKASDFWINLGKEDQTSTFDWKKRTYNMGEKLMDRIDYEEWALKGVDPTLGPSLNPQQVVEKRKERKEDQSTSKEIKSMTDSQIAPAAALNVPLLFPSTLLSSSGMLSSLQRMTASRQPHHQKRLIYCFLGMPLTIPFIFIPVIPNLPFFYLVWRAWSHWRALSSSKYLFELIKQGRIVPTPSQELDRILAIPSSSSTSPQPQSKPSTISSINTTEQQTKKDGEETKPKIDYEPFMLLKSHTIKDLVKTFNLEHQLSIDLTRARQQTIKSIQQGDMDKLENEAAESINSDNGKAKM